jgi:hypothetical protein
VFWPAQLRFSDLNFNAIALNQIAQQVAARISVINLEE